jgi:hypothetical protein
MDLTFFSMSFAGEFSIAWLILFCKSLKKVFISIIFLDLVGPLSHYFGAHRRQCGAKSCKSNAAPAPIPTLG